MGAKSPPATMSTGENARQILKATKSNAANSCPPAILKDRTNATSNVSVVTFSPTGTIQIDDNRDRVLLRETREALRTALAENKELHEKINMLKDQLREQQGEIAEARLMQMLYDASKQDQVHASVDTHDNDKAVETD